MQWFFHSLKNCEFGHPRFRYNMLVYMLYTYFTELVCGQKAWDIFSTPSSKLLFSLVRLDSFWTLDFLCNLLRLQCMINARATSLCKWRGLVLCIYFIQLLAEWKAKEGWICATRPSRVLTTQCRSIYLVRLHCLAGYLCKHSRRMRAYCVS